MLTQSEIDALLNGAIEIEANESQDSVNLAELMGKPGSAYKSASGEKQVRPYNFWSPDRFSKDQMRAIELIHEELGERLTNSLPPFLHTNVRPRVVHTEQGRFHDFMADMPANSLFHLVALAPLPGQIIITFSPEISFVILEQRLGGAAESLGRSHSLTDIDQSLLQDLVENMLNDVKASWGKVVSIEPKLVDSTVNQHWVQMLAGNERVMMVTFEMIIHDTNGVMNLYIPYSMLKPIANELNPHLIITGKKEQVIDPKARLINYDSLMSTMLPMRVVLGTTRVPVNDLLSLQIGDVIVLDSQVHQDVAIQVGERTRFNGKVGQQGKNIAIQITTFADVTNGSAKKQEVIR